MERLSLSQTMILAILLALLPVGVLSVWQSIGARENSLGLVRERLVHTARATAATQAIPFELALRTTDGLMHKEDVLAKTARCTRELNEAKLMANSTAMIAVARWTPDAHLVCSAPMPAQAANLLLQPLAAMRQSGDLVVPPVFTGPITGKRVLMLARPVMRDGRFDGYISAALEVSWIQRALTTQGLSPKAVAAIVGRDGRVLIGSPQIAQVRFDVVGGQGKAVDSKQGWLYSVSPLVDSKLFLVHAEPTGLLYSVPRRQLVIDLLFPLAVVLVASLTIWLALRWRVLRWLRELGRMAERFGRGDYSRDVTAFDRAPMELRALAERFDTMASGIETRDAELVDAADRNLSLAREVNHRVKNNLQIVTSLVAMQASEVREPAAKAALELTRARISAIGVIHKLLYDESDERMGTIDLVDLSEALCAQLRTSLARQLLTLKCTSNGGRVPLDIAVPLSLFVVQGMSDALAHARREGAQRHVDVRIERSGNSLSCTILHSGPASEVPLEEAEFRRTLMDIYAQQMKGALTIEESRETVRLRIDAPIPAADAQES